MEPLIAKEDNNNFQTEIEYVDKSKSDNMQLNNENNINCVDKCSNIINSNDLRSDIILENGKANSKVLEIDTTSQCIGNILDLVCEEAEHPMCVTTDEQNQEDIQVMDVSEDPSQINKMEETTSTEITGVQLSNDNVEQTVQKNEGVNVLGCQIKIELEDSSYCIQTQHITRVKTESDSESDIEDLDIKPSLDNIFVIDKEPGYRLTAYEISSDSESGEITSSSSSEEVDNNSASDSDSPVESCESPKKRGEQIKPKQQKLTIDEALPKIEDLRISVQPEEVRKLGTIAHTVGEVVVVQPEPNFPALDLDTVLFLEDGSSVGKIYDVFGPVARPLYAVRFRSAEEIAERGFKAGMEIFCAAQREEYTSFIFLEQLKRMKSSDASWRDDNECPPELADYSDDEQERAAKKKRKQRNQQGAEPGDNGDTTNQTRSNTKPGRGQNKPSPYRPQANSLPFTDRSISSAPRFQRERNTRPSQRPSNPNSTQPFSSGQRNSFTPSRFSNSNNSSRPWQGNASRYPSDTESTYNRQRFMSPPSFREGSRPVAPVSFRPPSDMFGGLRIPPLTFTNVPPPNLNTPPPTFSTRPPNFLNTPPPHIPQNYSFGGGPSFSNGQTFGGGPFGRTTNNNGPSFGSPPGMSSFLLQKPPPPPPPR